MTRDDNAPRRRGLPLLRDIRIASPCSASWRAMTGDDHVRHCGQCDKNVYDLSAMTADEAERLLAEHEGYLCVRLYRRRDGTIIHRDCPVGRRRTQMTRFAAAALAVGGAGLAAFSPAAAAPSPTPATTVDPGLRPPRLPPPTAVHPNNDDDPPMPMMGAIAPEGSIDDPPAVEMGEMAPRPTPAPAVSAPPPAPRVRMGLAVRRPAPSPAPGDGVPRL
ncbi:MAG: hypothetical protein AAF928_11690 [Myxococcota bacterium]